MSSSSSPDTAAAERARIEAEYRRRAREIDPALYAAWQPAEMLMRVSRRRAAATLLHREGVFPGAEDRCLEVGFGNLGWLAELLDWGVREPAIAGVDLDVDRVDAARRALPAADLRVADATELPWPDATFRLVIASTTFSSILDPNVRQRVAREITRVLTPGGALLFYDFAFDNPKNPNVKKVEKAELLQLFPALRGSIEKVTLAPPLARLVAPRSWVLATALERVPFLRTHLVAVLAKR